MDFASTLLDQAISNAQAGDLAAAEMFYRGFLAERPDNPDGALGLGLLLLQSGRAVESLPWLKLSAEVRPESLKAHAYYGDALRVLGHSAEAMSTYLIAACLQGAAINPADAQAHFNLGMAFNQADREAAAAQAYRRALAWQPAYAEAFNNLGISLQNLCRATDAVEAHRRAVALAPANAGFHCNLAHALLAGGFLDEGFEQWEWRVPSPIRDFTQPLWDGAAYPGKVLLAHAEQGFGDTLQFSRYLPLAAALGGRLVVECRAPIAGLLGRLDGVAQVIEWGQPLPPFDLHIPIPSLPRACRNTRPSIPADIPYLRADPQRLDRWRPHFDGDIVKVGLVWAGNPKGRDPRRALTLSDASTLAEVPGVRLFCLQKDRATDAVRTEPSPAMVDLGPLIADFDDLAAAVELVDLVITVDTAAAHLAGALGRPTWTLLHFSPDWRWQLEDQTTPWYPGMRLYRQRRPGDWAEVISRVAKDLGDLSK